MFSGLRPQPWLYDRSGRRPDESGRRRRPGTFRPSPGRHRRGAWRECFAGGPCIAPAHYFRIAIRELGCAWRPLSQAGVVCRLLVGRTILNTYRPAGRATVSKAAYCPVTRSSGSAVIQTQAFAMTGRCRIYGFPLRPHETGIGKPLGISASNGRESYIGHAESPQDDSAPTAELGLASAKGLMRRGR